MTFFVMTSYMGMFYTQYRFLAVLTKCHALSCGSATIRLVAGFRAWTLVQTAHSGNPTVEPGARHFMGLCLHVPRCKWAG